MENTQKPKIKVILADDHPVFRQGLTETLKQMKLFSKIESASNGHDVIDLLNREPYDLVLMDIKMSPVTGIEATRIIKNRFKNTKVIALSMYEDEKNVFEMLESGASGYLLKNADSEEIQDAIKDVISGHQYFSKEVSAILLDRIHKLNEKVTRREGTVLHKQRISEIIFLISHEFTSAEIGEVLFLSCRTVEDYRKQILEFTGSKNSAGITKYAIRNGIENDDQLMKKFGKFLSQKAHDGEN